MDRSLDETIAERQRQPRGSRRGGAPPSRRREYNSNNNYPRDGVRKSTRDDRTNLDNDWVHDRYEDDPDTTRRGYERPKDRRGRREDRHEDEFDHDRDPPPAKIRVENLNYELTEDDIYDLFTRIAPVLDAKLRYDRAGRSDGIAFVTYQNVADARAAIRDFDGANAKGQPIRLTLLPPPRRDNPFDKVENPRSLFDRIEAPGGRDRRRSQSPTDELEEDRAARRAPRKAPGPRDRRSDVTKPAPDGIDRYVPGQRGGRSSSHRGGRRPGERRERGNRDGEGPRMGNGRPRKTAEELDAEMDDYWGNSGAAQTENGNGTGAAPSSTVPAGGDDIDMIE